MLRTAAIAFALLVTLIGCRTQGRTSSSLTEPVGAGDAAAIGIVLDELYRSFGHAEGGEPDWERMRAQFVDGAQFVAETADGVAPEPQPVGEFIASWREAIRAREKPRPAQSETILRQQLSRVGRLIRVDIEFIAQKGTDPRARKPGLDSLTLVEVAGAWKVLSFVVHYESKL